MPTRFHAVPINLARQDSKFLTKWAGGVLALTLLAMPHQTHAWGNDGHRITGYIATALLTDAARNQVRLLLGHDDLAVIATKMDDDRDGFEQWHPGASRWHYENREVCGGAIACPQGQCITRQLESYVRVLQDSRATVEKRAEALIILVHLMADLHQPLHLTDNHDRGGNDLWVELPGERETRRLHEVWDTRLVRMNLQRRSPANYARTLLLDYQSMAQTWRAGDIQGWARETQKVGREIAYGTLPQFSCATGAKEKTVNALLSNEYVGASRTVVAEQLAKAGVRIAAVLNAALISKP